MKMEDLLSKGKAKHKKRERPWLNNKGVVQEEVIDAISNTTPDARHDIAPYEHDRKPDVILDVISDLDAAPRKRIDASSDNTPNTTLDTKPNGHDITSGEVSNKILPTKEKIDASSDNTPTKTPDIVIRGLSDSCRKVLTVLLALTQGTDRTPLIKHRVVTEITGIKEPTVKKAVQILEREGLIKRMSFKAGRQGGYQVRIIHEVRKYPDKISDTTSDKPLACSSVLTTESQRSDNPISTPATTEQLRRETEELKIQRQQINEALRMISFSEEARKYIGDDNVRELLRKGLSAVWLQRAIDIFTAVISEPDHRLLSPGAVFMSRARQGEFLNPPRGYIKENALKAIATEQLEMLDKLIDKEKESEILKRTMEEQPSYKGSLDDIPF